MDDLAGRSEQEGTPRRPRHASRTGRQAGRGQTKDRDRWPLRRGQGHRGWLLDRRSRRPDPCRRALQGLPGLRAEWIRGSAPDHETLVESFDPLFRRESGRMVAVLTRIFGVHNLSLAEDVVQDAFCRALEVWPFRGMPDDPSAWLMTTAKNRALDVLRRERTARTFAPEL